MELVRFSLEVFLKKMMKWVIDEKLIASDETEEDTLKEIEKGNYPPGLRLIGEKISKEKMLYLKEEMAKLILNDPSRHEFSFWKKLKSDEKDGLIKYVVDPSVRV